MKICYKKSFDKLKKNHSFFSGLWRKGKKIESTKSHWMFINTSAMSGTVSVTYYKFFVWLKKKLAYPCSHLWEKNILFITSIPEFS